MSRKVHITSGRTVFAALASLTGDDIRTVAKPVGLCGRASWAVTPTPAASDCAACKRMAAKPEVALDLARRRVVEAAKAWEAAEDATTVGRLLDAVAALRDLEAP